jgi:hypothetical protein
MTEQKHIGRLAGERTLSLGAGRPEPITVPAVPRDYKLNIVADGKVLAQLGPYEGVTIKFDRPTPEAPKQWMLCD